MRRLVFLVVSFSLNLENKDKYRQLCERECSIPLFSQAWWMEASCVKMNWDVFLVYDKNGDIIASMPYLFKSKFGLRYVCLPEYTQTNGIWIKPRHFESEYEKLSYEKKIISEFVLKIENLKLVYFVQSFHFKFTNWLPFYWSGYTQTTRYTYVLSDISNVDFLLSKFNDSKRRHIRKAEKSLTFCYGMAFEDFYSFCKKCYEKKNDEFRGSKDVIFALVNASKLRKQGEIFSVIDGDGNVHSALFCVWDKNSAYYLIPATDPDFKSSGASSFIIYKVLEYLKDKTKSFDFEGSMCKSIENSYSQYATTQVPYFTIKKRNIFNAFKFFC